MQLYEQDQNEVQTPVSTLLPLLPWLLIFSTLTLTEHGDTIGTERKKKKIFHFPNQVKGKEQKKQKQIKYLDKYT